MSNFEDIKKGLEQAIEYEKGKLKSKTTTLSILPVESFSPIEIKEIRKSTGLTQKLFAMYMGVSVKSVEAWESGKNHPDGAACRLLFITRCCPTFPFDSGIVVL